jgi:hypothetical protein
MSESRWKLLWLIGLVGLLSAGTAQTARAQGSVVIITRQDFPVNFNTAAGIHVEGMLHATLGVAPVGIPPTDQAGIVGPSDLVAFLDFRDVLAANSTQYRASNVLVFHQLIPELGGDYLFHGIVRYTAQGRNPLMLDLQILVHVNKDGSSAVGVIAPCD